MRKPLMIFLLCLALYHANGKALPEVDCIAAPYTAWSIVRHGSLDLRPHEQLHPFFDSIHFLRNNQGQVVTLRSVGSAIMAVPVVAPFALFREKALSHTNMAHLGKLAGAICAAAAVALFFCICRRIVPGASGAATVLFGLGTCVWPVASQASWMHGPATFWLVLALYFLFRPEKLPPGWMGFLAGLCLGMATFTRPSTAIFAIATGSVFLVNGRWRFLFLSLIHI